MTTYTSVPAAVEDGASAYAAAEAALTAAHGQLLALPSVYAGVYALGAGGPPRTGVKPFGYLESQQRANAARVLAGRVAEVLAAVVAAHQDDTARAQELGIDLPLPTGAATVQPDGGSR